MIGAIAGVPGNLLVGYLFYQRSGVELRHEAESLRQEAGRVRRLVNILGQALQTAGVIDVTWGPGGELNGIVIHMAGIVDGSSGAIGTVTVSQTPAIERSTATQKDSMGTQLPLRRRRRRAQS